MMFFNRRQLITLTSMQEHLRIREALAGAGIASSVKVWGTARAMERRARLGGGLREDVSYTVYVTKGDYDKASALLRTLRQNG